MTTDKISPNNACVTDNARGKFDQKANLTEAIHLKDDKSGENTSLPPKGTVVDEPTEEDKHAIKEEPRDNPTIIVEPSTNNRK